MISNKKEEKIKELLEYNNELRYGIIKNLLSVYGDDDIENDDDYIDNEIKHLEEENKKLSHIIDLFYEVTDEFYKES